MSLRAYITEVKKEFHDEFANIGVLDELQDFLEDHCSVFVAAGASAESDFQAWEIDREELNALIARVESGEIRCPDLGKRTSRDLSAPRRFSCGRRNLSFRLPTAVA